MADRLLVNYEELGTLATTAETVTQNLRDIRGLPGHDLSHSPKTAHGLLEFESAWDKRRDELADALGAVSQALRVISESFATVDTELTNALEGEG